MGVSCSCCIASGTSSATQTDLVGDDGNKSSVGVAEISSFSVSYDRAKVASLSNSKRKNRSPSIVSSSQLILSRNLPLSAAAATTSGTPVSQHGGNSATTTSAAHKSRSPCAAGSPRNPLMFDDKGRNENSNNNMDDSLDEPARTLFVPLSLPKYEEMRRSLVPRKQKHQSDRVQ